MKFFTVMGYWEDQVYKKWQFFTWGDLMTFDLSILIPFELIKVIAADFEIFNGWRL